MIRLVDRITFLAVMCFMFVIPVKTKALDYNQLQTEKYRISNLVAQAGQDSGEKEETEEFEFPEVVVEDQQVEEGFVADDSSTATKTDTPLIETPQSISVITKERIERQDAETLGEVLRYTPGVQSDPFGFEPRFTFINIRGFDATTSGIYRDGLQLRNPAFATSFSLEPYGAERIEILKGPSSILYGAGSPGGLINYVSKKPTNYSFGEVILEGGSNERFQGKFDVGGPIDNNGEFSFRLTGLARNSETQTDFVKDDRFYLAPSLRWQPDDNTRLTILAEFKYDESGSSQAIPADGSLRSNPNGDIPVNRFTGEPGFDDYDRKGFSIAYLFEHSIFENLTVRQNARYYRNELQNEVIFSTAFNDDNRTVERAAFDGDGELNGFVVDNQVEYGIFTGPLSHKFLAGVDYQYIDVSTVQAFGGAPTLDVFDPQYGQEVPALSVFLDNDITQQQLGIYLQDQLNLYRKFYLVLGGRYDWAENEVENNLNDTESSQDDGEFTGRAGILYLSDLGIAPYFNYSESFLPTIGTDANGDSFEPDTGRQFEGGIKYQPPGRDASVTIAAFDIVRENVLTPDPADPTLQVQTGEVRSRGIELEGITSMDFGLELIAAYTYQDVEITESNVPGEEGERPTQVPEHLASFWADYTFQFGILKNLGFGFGIRYLGSNFGDTPNTLEVPDNTLVDGVIHYDWKNFRAQINAKNLFDEEYVGSCFSRGEDDFCTFGQERTISASIGYRW